METSGAPDRGNLRAAAPAVGGCRSGRGLHDFKNSWGIVKLEHPAPIIAQPQTLPYGIPPHYGSDALDGMIGSGCVQCANLVGGLAAAPIVQLCGGFDDHGRIIPGRGNERNPRPWERKFSRPKLSDQTPNIITRWKTRKNYSRLDSHRADAILGHRGQRSPPTITTPTEETRR